jgi:hypothetical protein
MMAISVHQALYGYDRGHRLLASSTPIEGSAGRLLRAITDTAFDGRSTRYLTVKPVPDLRAQAVIRTWPATGDVRAGSVWSHVLLIDFVDLGRLEALAGVAGLFRHPEEAGVAHFYSTPLPIEDQMTTAIPAEFDTALAARLLVAIYSRKEAAVACDAPEEAEAILMRLWEQQWPRLRRSFSFRTRRRGSDGSATQFAIEVVERPARGTSEPVASVSSWMETLLHDLAFPSHEFRARLKTYGADSGSRADLPVLVDVLRNLDLTTSSPPVVVDRLARGFPESDAMRTLKRALVGKANSAEDNLVAWPRDEAVRLGLIFHANSPSFDFEDLAVGERLVELWHTRPQEAAYALAGVLPEQLPPDEVETLVAATAASAPVSEISRLAGRSPELTALVVARRPDLLADPATWDGDVAWQAGLVDLVAAADSSTKADVFMRLVDAGNATAAARVGAAEPQIWWTSLSHVAATKSTRKQQAQSTEALRAALNELGPAAVGSPLVPPTTPSELLLLAGLADLAAGLWRQVPAAAWVAVAENIATSSREVELDRWERQVRVLAIAVVAAATSGSPRLRAAAWRAAFVPLHDAFGRDPADDDLWVFVSRVLPPGTQWDRCERLRRGLAEEIRRDNWSSDDVDSVLASLPGYRDQVVQMLASARKADKKNRGWLRDLIDQLVP